MRKFIFAVAVSTLAACTSVEKSDATADSTAVTVTTDSAKTTVDSVKTDSLTK